MKNINIYRSTAFYLILFLLVGLNYAALDSLFGPIMFGLILSTSFYPLKNKVLSLNLKISNTMASVITLLTIVLIVIVPTIYIITSVAGEAVGLYGVVQEGMSDGRIRNFFFGDGQFASTLRSLSQLANIDYGPERFNEILLPKVREISTFVVKKANSLVGDTLSLTFSFVMLLLVVFALLVDGEKLKAYIFSVLPLPKNEQEEILESFSQMSFVTFICNGIGGVLQGGFAGILMFIIGLPSVVMWTVVMIILAFIPLVGISIVTVPTSVYLFITGKKVTAVVFLLTTMLFALWVENWFKAKYMGDKVNINPYLMLIYITGGMMSFGVSGLFYGPILCVLMLTVLKIYKRNYRPEIK